MPADFTVIIEVRHHFGDDPDALPGVFAGRNSAFEFQCPGVDSSKPAVLMFETLDVDHGNNFIAINSTGATPFGFPEVYGGIPVSQSKRDWNANIMLVRRDVLRESNILRLGARDKQGGLGGLNGKVDDFVIDNVVILYKTRRGPRATFGLTIG
jgi:hypothetical protein